MTDTHFSISAAVGVISTLGVAILGGVLLIPLALPYLLGGVLPPWEFDVLAALRREGAPYALSPGRLLQVTLVTSGTMTNRIDRLVGRRLLRRESDPGDGRGILVTLTDEGRTRVDAAITRLVDAEAVLLERISRADRDRLAALLRKLSLGFDV